MKVINKAESQLKIFESIESKNDFISIAAEFCQKKDSTPDEFGIKLRKWSNANMPKINILSLFSGAGGLDIGFEDVGFNIIESVEIEKKFTETTILNKEKGKYFTDTKILCEDIRNYIPLNLSVDFIIGGPPCQSFSSAGRRVAGVRGTKDDRGSLFEEYVRVLKILKPKGFLFENVYGILGAQKGEAIKEIISAFKDAGYELSYKVLNAADYGTPQFRERLILVGLANKEFQFPKPTHGEDSVQTPYYSALKALRNIPATTELLKINGRFGHLLDEIPPGLNYSFFTDKMGHPNPIFAWRSKFSDFLYKADPETPIRTLKASGGQYTGPFHWDNRRFSIAELKRLQTFPDSYEFNCNYALASKQIGNSVPPQFARFLALSVAEQVFNVKLPFNLYYLSPNEELSYHKQKRSKQKLYINKAREALAVNSSEKKDIKVNTNYNASLFQNFKWEKSNIKEDKYEVVLNLSEKIWDIKIKNNCYTDEIKYKINILTKDKSLFNNVDLVELSSNSYDLLDFTALWKAFEMALIDFNIKADLVQFNGYYQYKNNYQYSIKYLDSLPSNSAQIWNVISALFTKPKLIGKIEPSKFYEKHFHLIPSELDSIFKTLRSIGFEIRNHNTNPEIDENCYLIPYKFPTLSPLSVQLNKSL